MPKHDAQLRQRPVLWDLESLDSELLDLAWSNRVAFVERLRSADIDVPSCWYMHEWVVHRLAAIQYWYDDVVRDGATAEDAAEWWSEGLAPLVRDWEGLSRHRGAHSPAGRRWERGVPDPSVDEVIAESLRARREGSQ